MSQGTHASSLVCLCEFVYERLLINIYAGEARFAKCGHIEANLQKMLHYCVCREKEWRSSELHSREVAKKVHLLSNLLLK